MTTIEEGERLRLDEPAMGERLNAQVRECLGDRLMYRESNCSVHTPNAAASCLDELDNYLEVLAQERTEISADQLQTAWSEASHGVAFTTQVKRLSQHKTQLVTTSRVLTGGPDTRWAEVESDDRFAAVQAAVGDKLASGKGPIAYEAVAGPTADEAETLIDTEVMKLTEEIKKIIPLPDLGYNYSTEGRIRNLLSIMFAGRIVAHVAYDEGKEYLSPKDEQRLVRKANQLNDLLCEIADDPAAVVVRAWLEAHRSEIEKSATDSLDRTIAAGNQQVMAAPKAVQNNEIEPKPARAEDGSIDAGRRNLSLPWVNAFEPTTTEVKGLRLSGETAYVIQAIAPGVKAELPNPEAADEIIAELVARTAAGVMPYARDTDQIELSQLDGRAGAYGEGKVWYTPDLTITRPRIFYTIRLLTDVLPDYRQTEGLEVNAKCVVILAVTDPANHHRVVKQISGNNSAVLKAVCG